MAAEDNFIHILTQKAVAIRNSFIFTNKTKTLTDIRIRLRYFVCPLRCKTKALTENSDKALYGAP
ncbi:MAG: hypothetical protein LUI60_00560, partial [Clostridia bacterium]|nr:hypothetical protein [Clostridia bacterium]